MLTAFFEKDGRYELYKNKQAERGCYVPHTADPLEISEYLRTVKGCKRIVSNIPVEDFCNPFADVEYLQDKKYKLRFSRNDVQYREIMI